LKAGILKVVKMNEASPSWEEEIDFDSEENQVFLVGKKILIIDDCPDQQLLYQFILKKLSKDVDIVDSGAGAINILQKNDVEYDAIILDYFMPDMNGLETAIALRDCGFTSPIIGMSANYEEVDKYGWFVAGCDAILKKPINREQFIKHLSYCFALGSGSN
jgi:CheY-like chemotaxis protein